MDVSFAIGRGAAARAPRATRTNLHLGFERPEGGSVEADHAAEKNDG
jgi:hypothetical protein